MYARILDPKVVFLDSKKFFANVDNDFSASRKCHTMKNDGYF